jgi:hypothetical protein
LRCALAGLIIVIVRRLLLCLPARSFVAVFVTYCGLGTFIKSRLPNHSDACYNNIPQRDFWFDLPSLVSDGAIFAVSLGERKANKHGTYESIGASTPNMQPPSR